MDTEKFRAYQRFDKIPGWSYKISEKVLKDEGYMVDSTEDIMFNNFAIKNLISILKEKKGIVKEMKILDIGCGSGLLVLKLDRLGFDTYGLTANEEDIKNCEFAKSKVKQGDMHELPFEDDFFDAVIINQCLEHAISPYIVLCEINRVLKKDGVISIIIPKDGTFWNFCPMHFSCMSMYQLSSLLQKTNFYPIFNFRGKVPIATNELKELLFYYWIKKDNWQNIELQKEGDYSYLKPEELDFPIRVDDVIIYPINHTLIIPNSIEIGKRFPGSLIRKAEEEYYEQQNIKRV